MTKYACATCDSCCLSTCEGPLCVLCGEPMPPVMIKSEPRRAPFRVIDGRNEPGTKVVRTLSRAAGSNVVVMHAARSLANR